LTRFHLTLVNRMKNDNKKFFSVIQGSMVPLTLHKSEPMIHKEIGVDKHILTQKGGDETKTLCGSFVACGSVQHGCDERKEG
jgi:DNA-binding transcriptional regulator WhiA